MAKKDDERLKNLILFRLYMTNSELKDFAPTLVITIVVIFIFGLFMAALAH